MVVAARLSSILFRLLQQAPQAGRDQNQPVQPQRAQALREAGRISAQVKGGRGAEGFAGGAGLKAEGEGRQG